MFYVIMPSLRARQALIERLKTKSILAVFHYLPLHLSPMGRKFGAHTGDCPVTKQVSNRILRLPFYTALSRADQNKVIETITGFSATGGSTCGGKCRGKLSGCS